MSSEDSEVDDFFDAEEDTSVGTVSGRRSGGDSDAVTRCRLAQLSSDSLDDSSESGAAPSSPKAAAGVSGGELEARRNKLAHLRQNVTGEVASGASGGGCDDDGPTTSSSPQHSQSGSVETARASSHPFRKMEPDAQSLVSQLSLGKLGRILSGQEELEQLPGSMPPPAAPPPLQQPPPAAMPPPPTPTSSAPAPIPATSTPAALQPPPPLQEPDIVSSAKGIVLPASPVPPGEDVPAAGVSCDDDGEPADIPPLPMVLIAPAPVAPPRRRRKRLVNSQLTSPPLSSTPGSSCASMTPSPGSLAPIPSDACLSVPSASRFVPPTASLRTRRLRRSLLCHQPVPERPDVSLDLRAAVRGQYVVKPQDEESTRAPPITAADRLDVISVQSDASSLADSLASSYIGAHSSSRDMLRLDELKEAQEFLRSHEIQTDICVKTKTDSGRRMTDKEILDQVSVLNLDTGERIPLSAAEERLPGCINPLSLQIMRMTSEYVSDSSLERDGSDDDQARLVIPPREIDEQPDSGAVRRKTQRLKRFLGRTVNKARDRAETLAQKMAQVRHREEKDAFECMAEVADALTVVRVPMKASSSHKGPYEFDQMLFVQDLSGEHIGPIWCMKFSSCGRLLATAGQDHVLRVWVLKSAYRYFFDMRTKYSAEKVSPTPSQESLVSQQSSDEALLAAASAEATTEEEAYAPFMPRPLCKYTGHTADLLDISWSKNYFILSSSMDKTVRLWHISRKECLCCFQHIEFVTAIAFHPKDDRYFLSGSLDGKLRLWNIPDKKVALWNELDGQAKLITAANFCQNGRFAVVGSYDGRCVFYSTDQLKYHTQIHVRSSRGRNARGRKISGIEPMPGEDKILVTSNDSRIRVYDLRDLNLSCKYKGFVNSSSQIKASFSHDGKFIVAGSENQCVYLWKTHHDYSKFSSVRRDRNGFWEGIRAHEAQVTCALFAPHPDLVFQYVDAELGRLETVAEEGPSTPGAGEKDSQSSRRSEEAKKDSLDKKSVGSGGTSTAGYVVVTADFNGVIKVFLNRTRPKHSSLPASALL